MAGRGNTELRDSFDTRTEAAAFARVLKARLGDATVRPLTVGSNIPTDANGEPTWWRVAVSKRLLERAEDMRAAWDAVRAFKWEVQDAASFDAEGVGGVLMVEAAKKSAREVGLTPARRAFLEEAGSGNGASPWDHASDAVAFAKRAGFVRKDESNRAGARYYLTDEGEKFLAEVPS